MIQVKYLNTPVMYNISVSKFCCPVCWQFLKVLNETNSNVQFTARAHHSNLYAVCLPPWLPEPVLQKMIEHFREILYEKLCQLADQPSRLGHSRDLSLESAGESVSSSGSSLDAETVWADQAV